MRENSVSSKRKIKPENNLPASIKKLNNDEYKKNWDPNRGKIAFWFVNLIIFLDRENRKIA
jgi:hypothetical protein